MKNTFLVLLLAGFSCHVTGQEKWSTIKPAAYGNYVKLPSEINAWQNTNTQIAVYQFGDIAITVGPNFRVNPNFNQQDEIILVGHPTNQNIMFGAANTTASGIYGQGGYITTNGGLNWTGNDLLPPFTQSSSDPGPTIDKNGTIIFTVLDPTMCAAYSTNNGLTWSSRVFITNSSSDKNFAASDDAPSSTYYGRSYCVWSNFASGSPPIVSSYTTNGGVSWNGVIQINTSVSGHYSQGADIAVGPNGEVYVCWAAPISGSPYTEDFIGFAKSTTGGTSWVVTNNAYDANGIRANTFNGWNFRVNSFPRITVDRTGGPRNGWIYIVHSDRNLFPSGTDADVILHRSTDGGATWSPGIRVNQDPLNNGKVQFFPTIRVDEFGGVNVVFYDNRNYPSVGDSCETFMARSTNGGDNWVDFVVSDHRWLVKGEAGLGSYGGDYIGVSSGNGNVWPFWFDDKTGTMQAWTCQVNLGLVGISENGSEIPNRFQLRQNFPNPFNPTTVIDFSVPKAGNVKLEVFNVIGQRVATLVDEVVEAGNYRYDFNASELPSGIYFYTLTAKGVSITKRMMLIK